MSDRRKYLILIGAIAAALVGAIMLAVPGSPVYQKPTLGLDLQGGLEVVLKAVPPKGHKLTPEDLDRSITIMQRRINKLGVSEPEIRKRGTDQIVIQLAGVHDPAAAAKLIGTTAQLLFFDFETDLVGPSTGPNNTPVATSSLYDLLKQVQPPAGSAAPEAYYLFKNNTVTKKPAKKGGKPTTITTHSIKGTAPTRAELLKPFNGRVPDGYEVLKVPAHRLVVSCAASTGCLGASAAAKNGTYYYLFKYFPNNSEWPPELTGKDLDSAGSARTSTRARVSGRRCSRSRATARRCSRRSRRRSTSAGRSPLASPGPGATATASSSTPVTPRSSSTISFSRRRTSTTRTPNYRTESPVVRRSRPDRSPRRRTSR